jgi:hypothetical protein
VGSRSGWYVGAQTLTIPPGAASGDARITIGEDLPADLVAYYAATGFPVPASVLGGVVFFAPSGDYCYLVEVDYTADPPANTPRMACGVRNNMGITELWQIYPKTPGFLGGVLQLTGPNGNGAAARIANDLLFDANGNLKMLFASNLLQLANGATLQIGLGSPFTIDGISHERGFLDRVDSTANTAAIGAEAVVLTGNSVTFRNNRAYEILVKGRLTSSVANISSVRTRKTNLAGASLAYDQVQFSAAQSTSYYYRNIIKRVAGTDLTDNLVLTLAASAGTVIGVAAADAVRYMEVRDCGDAAKYPNAIAI